MSIIRFDVFLKKQIAKLDLLGILGSMTFEPVENTAWVVHFHIFKKDEGIIQDLIIQYLFWGHGVNIIYITEFDQKSFILYEKK